jgi:hypothetical protein
MKFVANQMKNDEAKGLQRDYFLYFVPCRTIACEKVYLSFCTFNFYSRICMFYTSTILFGVEFKYVKIVYETYGNSIVVDPSVIRMTTQTFSKALCGCVLGIY